MTPWLRGLQTLLAATLAFWLLCVGPLAWTLRDGLGPDSVTTTGLAALWKFSLTFFWGPVALLLTATLTALELHFRHFARRH